MFSKSQRRYNAVCAPKAHDIRRAKSCRATKLGQVNWRVVLIERVEMCFHAFACICGTNNNHINMVDILLKDYTQRYL